MPRTTHSHTTLVARFVGPAVLAIALVACSGVAGDAPDPSRSPLPSTGQSAPTPVPSTSAGVPPIVELATATGHHVTVRIEDRAGHLVSAASGTPGDGATVAPYTVVATNVDARTVRLTWSDMPGDNALTLLLLEDGGIVVVQPAHAGDAIAFDRILDLTFDGPVDAASLRVSIQDGLDTPG